MRFVLISAALVVAVASACRSAVRGAPQPTADPRRCTLAPELENHRRRGPSAAPNGSGSQRLHDAPAGRRHDADRVGGRRDRRVRRGFFTNHVNIGFFHGASLSDPAGLLEGTGKSMRHVKIKPDAAVDTAALEALITAACRDIVSRLANPD